ncbi:nitronate monooxygenase family protein [Mycobacterium sp. AT1]|uniref:NAD(P)H-dependent flavin oxidoreductase n=1 Tax=Mycobacterium sp. AT1 TaxID=1961706 RepID=UPI0009ABDC17|nr:nitronate monooxygenase [Mycobacterium sp. AT1]OPX11912.1 2-nitropropane dioxygenase [Mycobacterium sp. AT1]
MSTPTVEIATRITQLLGIRVPVVQAAMSWASSSSALPLSVTNAGGLGSLAAGPMRPADLDRALDELADDARGPYAVNLPLSRPNADDVLDTLAKRAVPVFIGSQGGPRRYVERMHGVGSKCIHVVASVEHAEKAQASGVDGLIVVGGEAGGHPPPQLVSSLVMLRAVRKALPDFPIIASGGFVDGAGLAAALTLGADAAQFGTRFIASDESNVHPSYRQAVVDAGVSDTRTVGTELGVIRALRNDFTDRMEILEAKGSSIEERRGVFNAASLKMAAFDGDVDGGKIEAGQSAGLIDRVQPAADIVDDIVAEYRRIVEGLPVPRRVPS